MVRTKVEVEHAARIEGGFVLMEVPWLIAAWRACRSKPLGVADFRTLLACREMVARRCRLAESRDRSPTYDFPELAKLLGTTERRARASVRGLEAAGLLTWAAESIGFPAQVPADEEQVRETIGRGKGSVAIPRRILRFLASGARPAIIATVLGVLLRCVSRRKSGFDGRGRVKASWIAKTFAVSIPAVKAARRQLVEAGWIEPEESSQWSMNRFGRVFRINLGWSDSSTSGGAVSIPPRQDHGPISIPPDLQTRNPSGRELHQEPGPEPAGFEIKGKGGEGREPADTKLATVSTKLVQGQPLPAPTLADVQVADLKDTGRLLQLHDQAVAKGIITTSEADRLRLVTAAEHALAVGKSNPAGLFSWLIRGRCWRYLTAEDEDRASRRLREVRRSPVEGRPLAGFAGLSSDAEFVGAMRAATIRAGIFRDPWPTVQARDPRWTRARWDRAMVELGLG